MTGNTGWASVNNRITPLDQAQVGVTDLGFLRGMAVFESLRSYSGKPHALERHYQRLISGAEAIGINLSLSFNELASSIAKLAYKVVSETEDTDTELRINIIITPGKHSSGVFGGGNPTTVVIMTPLTHSPRNWYEQGVATTTFSGERILALYKTTNYLTGFGGLQQAQSEGAHEAIYCNNEGYLIEGVTSNILIRRGQEIWEPSGLHLSGITQQSVRSICQDLGFTWLSHNFTRDDVVTADECWICSAFRELVPVTSIDNKSVSDGQVGEWAPKILNELRKRHQNEGYDYALTEAEK